MVRLGGGGVPGARGRLCIIGSENIDRAGPLPAITLLLYQTLPKVLKDALAHLGPYQTLRRVWYSDPGGMPATIQI